MKSNETITNNLDKEQLAAVEAPLGNICINAIAGSGKTRVLTHRVANMIDNGYSESEMMLLTFTDKASQEMKTRIKDILKKNDLKLFAGTFHSIASRFLRKYASKIGMDESFTILTPYKQIKLMDNCRDKVVANYEDKDDRFPSANVLVDIYSSSINHDETFVSFMKKYYGYFTGERIDVIITIFEDYVCRKQDENTLDFDDLLISFYDLLCNKEISEEITSHIKYIFVDEYQDINQLQYDILKKLNKNNSIFVIGDTAQCIYQFRGSKDEYIEDFAKQYSDPHIYNLTYNYRSDAQILNLAEAVINKNKYNRYIRCNTVNDEGQKPLIIQCETESDEADAIASIIKSHLFEEIASTAIIVRKGTQAGIIEQALRKQGIPYNLGGEKSVYEQQYMKDLLSLVSVHVNYKDETSFTHAIKLFPGVYKESATSIYNNLKAANFDFTKFKMHMPTNQFKAFYGVKRIIEYKPTSVADLLQFIMNSVFKQYLIRKHANSNDKIAEVQSLISFTKNIININSFLDTIALNKNTSSQQTNSVTIMTMHKSKGLEWDNVFIPFITKGEFPRCNNRDYENNAKHVKNERNLLYVGITRARYRLVLSCSKTYGENKAGKSQFIEELWEENQKKQLFDYKNYAEEN